VSQGLLKYGRGVRSLVQEMFIYGDQEAVIFLNVKIDGRQGVGLRRFESSTRPVRELQISTCELKIIQIQHKGGIALTVRVITNTA